jgi:hypothetical protein
MRFVRTGLACTAVLLVALTAGVATSAAAEGPFYKVNGARLNGSKTFGAAAEAEYVFKVEILGIEATVKCKEMAVGAGATITGLNTKSSDTSEQTIVLKMCSLEKGGVGCIVEGNEIKTNALVGVLAYSETGRKGEILELFHPKVGKEIVNVKFVGANCFVTEGKLEGSFAGEVLTKARRNILVEGAQAEEVTAALKFPVEPIKKVWIEVAGVEKEEPVALTFRGVEAKMKGESLVGNVNGVMETFSVYTK